MVDPTNVIKFDRNEAELQEWFIFSVAVAGKTAKNIVKAVDRFLNDYVTEGTPFERIKIMKERGILLTAIKESKLGNWGKMERALTETVMSGIDLRTCSVADLEAIHGIGPKTARMFILHSRPKQRIAALDTHILKFLATLGHTVPKTTPSGKKYALLEDAFLEHCDNNNLDYSEFDLQIWNSYARQ